MIIKILPRIVRLINTDDEGDCQRIEDNGWILGTLFWDWRE